MVLCPWSCVPKMRFHKLHSLQNKNVVVPFPNYHVSPRFPFPGGLSLCLAFGSFFAFFYPSKSVTGAWSHCRGGSWLEGAGLPAKGGLA